MENTSINKTLRKDGWYMGKFCIDCDDSGRAMYQYVYGRTYDEAESMLMKYFETFRNTGDFFILSGTDKPVEPRTMQYRYKKIVRSADIKSACHGRYV